jgi:cytoskeleton protein RodZ
MPEIGETLREARMRAKIDVSEVEAATKIRAKYLRALENEEWRLLPGPTFVRTFLRTYADYLGLDSKLLVEEYRLRHEGPSELDLAPIAPNLGPERMRLPAPRLSRGWIIGLAVLGLIAVLIVLGSVGGGKPNDNANVASQRAGPRKPKPRTAPGPAASAPAKPTTARLALVPTDAVYVCLVDARGKALIDGAIVQPGGAATTYKGKRFQVLFGHGPQAMKVNGRTVSVPASSDPIGYEITPRGRRTLAQSRLPTCTQ